MEPRRSLGLVAAFCACSLVAAGTCAAGRHEEPSKRGPAQANTRGAATPALAAIARLVLAGRIDTASAKLDVSAVVRAVRLIDLLPAARREPVAAALDQVNAIAAELTLPRALAVFGQLAVNDDWFARHGPPAAKTDITDSQGIVYRYFPGDCFEFHPLANFAALNADAAAKHAAATAILAAALGARAIPEPGGGLGWEYFFDYAGGHAPWLSGFAEAVAAQAFARAAAVLPAEATQLRAEASRAFATLPGRLVERTASGPWIKLYGFSGDVVLNAQLQTVISLESYAQNSGNVRAAQLANSLRTAAARALPLFDTGAWTYYSLAHDVSPLSYQDYVVQLLQRLAPDDPRFAAAATRFASYAHTPPRFRLGGAGAGAVDFWVSKPATVRITAFGRSRELAVDGGWHLVEWPLPGRAGIFPVSLRATDWAGNSATAAALPLVEVAAPPHPHRRRPLHMVARGAETGPLVIGAGLSSPGQAGLAEQDGFGAVRMTLVWPSGASSPTPGALAALNRLPAGTKLVLEVDAGSLPADAPDRAALAEYAAATAAQVPALQTLILGPAVPVAQAANYETALAAVYDAVKQAAPTVQVAATLDGLFEPSAVLSALASAYSESGRAAPLMDALAFQPAPSAGAGQWTLSNLGTLESALATAFAATVEPATTLPVIVDQLAYGASVPVPELTLYEPPPAAGGLSSNAQAAAYASAFQTAACVTNVSEVLLGTLVDTVGGGTDSGLYYPDVTPKPDLSQVLKAVTGVENDGRGCVTPTTPPPTTTPPSTTPTPAPSPSPTSPSSVSVPPTTTQPAPTTSEGSQPLAALATPTFPTTLSTTTPPRVGVSCATACLFLVILQRRSDGTPVLATRGVLAAGARTAVRLPDVPFAAGAYRFAVWSVAQDAPMAVEVDRSATISTSG